MLRLATINGTVGGDLGCLGKGNHTASRATPCSSLSIATQRQRLRSSPPLSQLPAAISPPAATAAAPRRWACTCSPAARGKPGYEENHRGGGTGRDSCPQPGGLRVQCRYTRRNGYHSFRQLSCRDRDIGIELLGGLYGSYRERAERVACAGAGPASAGVAGSFADLL